MTWLSTGAWRTAYLSQTKSSRSMRISRGCTPPNQQYTPAQPERQSRVPQRCMPQLHPPQEERRACLAFLFHDLAALLHQFLEPLLTSVPIIRLVVWFLLCRFLGLRGIFSALVWHESLDHRDNNTTNKKSGHLAKEFPPVAAYNRPPARQARGR